MNEQDDFGLENALECLVRVCNNHELFCNFDEVIHAEAVLERLYMSRLAKKQQASTDEWIEAVSALVEADAHERKKLAESMIAAGIDRVSISSGQAALFQAIGKLRDLLQSAKGE